MRYLKNLFHTALSLTTTAFILFSTSLSAERYLPNGIAAIVEDKIVTYEDVRSEMAPLMSQITRSATSPDEVRQKVTQVSQEILQNIIDRILIVKEFKDEGLIIPQSYIENEYDDVLTEQFGGDRARFLSFLKRQNKTVREFRKDLEEKIIVQSMRAKMRRSQSEISPEKIEEYYTRNKFLFLQEESIFLQQILLTPYADETTSLLSQEAEKIIRELNMGADFSSIARKYSRDDMASNGGEWGWIKKNEIRKELEEIAFNLPRNSYSQPIVLDGNVFILYVKDKHEQGVKPLDQVRDEIEDKILEQIAQNAQRKWVDRLRKEAYIRYF
jgi:peptidyl-prolyl cis-trans isomerase SurA